MQTSTIALEEERKASPPVDVNNKNDTQLQNDGHNGENKKMLHNFDLEASEPIQNEQGLFQFDLINNVTLAQFATWDEEKQKKFVDDFPPSKLRDVMLLVRRLGLREDSANLSFRNLFYKKNGAVLVNGVSGYLMPGEAFEYLMDE